MEASESMLALAGPDLFRRNAFRVTGLPVDAGPADVRRYRQLHAARQEAAAAAGTDAGPDGAEVRAALEALADPRTRIVHELLWTRGDDVTACGCTTKEHRRHDRFVLACQEALEDDGSSVSWEPAEDAWHRLGPAAVRRHLGTRIRALADPRLTQPDAGRLVKALPEAVLVSLLRTGLHTPDPRVAALGAAVGRWPCPEATTRAAVERIVGPLRDRIRVRLDEIERRTQADPAAGAGLVERQTDDLRRLRHLAPAASSAATRTLLDETAMLLVEAWQRMSDRGRMHPGDRDLGVERQTLALATSLAGSRDVYRVARDLGSVLGATAHVWRWIEQVRADGDGRYLLRLMGARLQGVADENVRAGYGCLLRHLTPGERRTRDRPPFTLLVIGTVGLVAAVVAWMTLGARLYLAVAVVLAGLDVLGLFAVLAGRRGYRQAIWRHLRSAP